MKALSLRQPWAWLVASGIKDVENRTWPTKRRERIYIHAGKSSEIKVQGLGDAWITSRLTIAQYFQYREAEAEAEMVRGAIIGEVTITDCKFRFPDENANLYSKWAESGLYGFTLTDAILYEEPIPCRGALGFFEPDLSATERKKLP